MTTAAVQDALAAWVVSLAAVPGLTAAARPPQPGDKPPLPTVAIAFDRVTNDEVRREVVDTAEDGTTTDFWGWREAQARVIFRCSSEADALAALDTFPALAWYGASEASDDRWLSVPLTVVANAIAFGGKLILTGGVDLVDPERTQTVGLWVVVHDAVVTYPQVSVSPRPGGLLAISVVVSGVEFFLCSGGTPLQPALDE